MELDHPNRKAHRWSPMAAAAILLGVYVAMYLAVGAIVHLLGTPSVSARVPGNDWIELAPGVPAQTTAAERIAAPKEQDDVHVD